MTDQEAQKLGQRAVKCSAWKWLPGMVTDEGYRVVAYWYGQDEPMYLSADGDFWQDDESAHWPDLRDPATRGCLLELVREAWGDPYAHVVPFEHDHGTGWRFASEMVFSHLEDDIEGDTEAWVLVSALEAAPAR